MCKDLPLTTLNRRKEIFSLINSFTFFFSLDIINISFPNVEEKKKQSFMATHTHIPNVISKFIYKQRSELDKESVVEANRQVYFQRE